MEGLAEGTMPSAHGTPMGKFSCKAHIDLSLYLTEGYVCRMTKEGADINLSLYWPSHTHGGGKLF